MSVVKFQVSIQVNYNIYRAECHQHSDENEDLKMLFQRLEVDSN